MNPIISAVRLWTVMLLGTIMLFSFPAPFFDEARGMSAGGDGLAESFSLSHPKETYQKPAIRAQSHGWVKMIAAAKALPFFAVLPILMVWSCPRPSLPFLPIIYIAFKRIYLKPLKFTSRFVVCA
ncbi:hypothetical protein ACE41H_14510 [Paenibacillus enshidis]|uniref:Uncharacterized protein n=1 Tax=Paenibacillus enshidis TaxID=1458439 RepID=A0ABV5AUT5_9BACL